MSQPREQDISRDIQERVHALAEALGRHPAVERLLAAWRVVQEHEAARIMLRDLRQRERALLSKELAGEAPAQQEVEGFRRLWEISAYNPYLRELFEAEAAVARLLGGVQALLHQYLGLPDTGEAGEAGGGPGTGTPGHPGAPPGAPPASSRPPQGSQSSLQRSEVKVARTRLWVPGQP